MKREDRTSIQLFVTTRDRLLRLGRKNDTYDDIINRLLDHAERKWYFLGRKMGKG